MEISIRKLLQADEAITAPLEMVNTRLKKRAEREPGELTKDEAHICLLDERRVLLTNRQMLQKSIETAQRIHHSVTNMAEELAEDLALKHDTWKIDEACLQSVPGYLLRAKVHEKLDPGPGHPEDRARLDAARDMLRRAQKKEKLSASMREQFTVLERKSTRDTANCRVKTEAALKVRATELQELEKQLEVRRKSVDGRLAKHKLEMDRTAWQKANTEQCQKFVKKVELSRRHRKAYENLEDEVSLALVDNSKFLEDNCKELEYCKEENNVSLRQLGRAREIISGDIERKRRTLQLELNAASNSTRSRAGGAHTSPEQSWAVKTTSDHGYEEESNLWGNLFQPAEEPSPSVSPDVTAKATDEIVTEAKPKSPGYDPHAATMSEEDLEILRRYQENKRHQREMKMKEEQKRLSMYATKIPKEEKLGTKEEQRIAAEEENRRRRTEFAQQRGSLAGEKLAVIEQDPVIEQHPAAHLLCRKVQRGPKGDRKAFTSPIYV